MKIATDWHISAFSLAFQSAELLNAHMRRAFWIAISITAAIVLLLAAYGRQLEPSYESKPLSSWLRGFESDTLETRMQSADAIRHIGTNAVPLLIKYVRKNQPAKEQWWRQKLRSILLLLKINLPRPANERAEVLAALDALGPVAKDAVPAVEALLHENPPDPRAPFVLARLGPDAVPALTRGLTNDEKIVRLGSRVCLEMLQSHSEFLFPKAPQDAEFMRRTCEFNLKVLKASFDDYKTQHPDQFMRDGTPEPSLPPNFIPPEILETNHAIPALPKTSPGYE